MTHPPLSDAPLLELGAIDRPILEQLRVPTYFLHGALDFVPVSQVEVLKKYAVNADLTVVVEPAGDHCCHNLGPRPRLEMVDWVADQLGSAGLLTVAGEARPAV